MSTRPVPVPATCESLYAVMTAEPLEHEDHVPLPHAALLRAHGTSPQGLERLEARPHQLVLQSQAPVAEAAAAARDTRVQALERAARHDGVVVELLTPRVLELTSEDVSLAHAAQWYVLDHAALLDGDLVTDGLAQFGLPDVRVRAVGSDDVVRAMSSAVLAGVVHRLIAEWPEHDPVGEATVTLRDIAYGLGDVQASVTPHDRGVRISIDYVADDHVLAVELLDDPATTLFA